MCRFAEQNDFRASKPVKIGPEVVPFRRGQVLTRPMQEIDQFAVGALANALGCW
jgi:hypothetical protein